MWKKKVETKKEDKVDNILSEMSSTSYLKMKQTLEVLQSSEIESRSFTIDERLKIIKELSSITNKTTEIDRIIISHLKFLEA